MNEEGKNVTMRWYYRPVWVIIGILVAGPFALPLVWFSPALKRWNKIFLTAVVLLITLWLAKATMDIFQLIMKEMADLQNAFK